MIKKLITKEDPYFLHKSMGIFSLLHFFYQFGCFAYYGRMYLHWIYILPHILLHVSSFIFHVLDKRPVSDQNKIVKKMAMFIWEELRIHSMLFGCRAAFIILFPEYRFFIVMMTMYLADLTSKKYGNSKVTTVRGNHQIEKSTIKQMYADFFSGSQMGATIICAGFFQRNPSDALVFSTLPPIQTSAFGMTLMRKDLISKTTWQIVYSLELALVYILWYALYNDVYIFIYSLNALLMRKFGMNKYLLWTIFYVTHNYYFLNIK